MTHERRTLRDGTRLQIRRVRGTDAEGLRDLFRRLSTTSRYHRFHAHVSELSPAMWRYLSNVDGDTHFALLALPTQDDGVPQTPIGVARFIRLPGRPTYAEVAITVVDDFHRRGLGRLLLRALTKAGRERGIRTFVAHLLPGNLAMKRLLVRAGAREASSEHFGVTYELPLRQQPRGLIAAWRCFFAQRGALGSEPERHANERGWGIGSAFEPSVP